MRIATALAAIVAIGVAFIFGAAAQDAPVPKRTPPSSVPKKAEPSRPSQRDQTSAIMPDAGKIVLLLRNTLITLNDAIQTGNFTVLRDRAAPSFRDINSASRLSQAFADLASRNVDLSWVAVISPQLTEQPSLDEKAGMLRLKGYFPMPGLQVHFDALYQVIGGRWRLFGLSVDPISVVTVTAPSGKEKGEAAGSSDSKTQKPEPKKADD